MSCADAPSAGAATDAAAYTAALQTVGRDPVAASERCAAIRAPGLRADCITAAAEALAGTDPQGASRLCASVPPGIGRDECGFQVAERSGEPTRCIEAGRFLEDCRMHLWSRALASAIPRGTDLGDAEPRVVALAAQSGFTDDDPRPWIVLTRYLLGAEPVLDRSACDDLTQVERQRTCRSAARDLFHDRINHVRDTGRFPCDGGPLPAILGHTADPGLEGVLAERRAQDLCP